VFTHVDYHSKNLMLEPDKQLTIEQNLGILDFQDAMFGPITYDIASLLQDAYIIWPEKLIEAIVFKHYDYLINQNNKFNLSNNLSKDQFLKYFYLTGLQRHIKNLGIFARLKYFYNKPNYIQYIPNLLHYINQTCNKYNDPELLQLKNLLQNIECYIMEHQS
ncbi:MAG: phosphotransferase, partial [Gammaproteobacteria bacterium]